MKKILILLTILSSTAIFADKHNSQDKILEHRIENTLNYKFKVLKDGNKSLTVNEYDIDVYGDYVNAQIEVSSNPKDFDFLQALIPIKEEIIKNIGNDCQINVVVEQDKIIGEDEVIYNIDL